VRTAKVLDLEKGWVTASGGSSRGGWRRERGRDEGSKKKNDSPRAGAGKNPGRPISIEPDEEGLGKATD